MGDVDDDDGEEDNYDDEVDDNKWWYDLKYQTAETGQLYSPNPASIASAEVTSYSYSLDLLLRVNNERDLFWRCFSFGFRWCEE